jgi:pimeloyl-ACP methyl ester carboxylesterase
MNRRNLLMTVAAGTAAAATAAQSASAAKSKPAPLSDSRISTLQTQDGTRLFCKDWGSGAPMVFVHSWALNGNMWQYQTVDFAVHGIRCITYDRRGHGRSDQPATGYDTNTLADDLAMVLESLDLTNATLVGHSMGGGEIVRYLSRHGAQRVARIVLLAPTTPFLKQTADNPDGIPIQAFEALRRTWAADFPKWLADNTAAFFTKDTSLPMQQWGISMMLPMSVPIAIACNEAMVDTDFRADLRAIAVPALVIHGDADASAPLALTGAKTAALIPHCELKVYEGAPHGLFITHKERVNADIMQFVGRT